MNSRQILALLLPFIACAIQWLLWDTLKPYVWFLFFPAAFFSAWLGGLRFGILATVLDALLVWYVFIPPSFSFQLNNPAAAFSIVIFIIMGGLYAWVFHQLAKTSAQTRAALAETQQANEKISALYERTLELDTLKSQFFANISHELRTPLTLILAPLQQRLQQPLSERERRSVEMMLRNVQLLYRHVTDLLDTAKLEARRMTVNWNQLDLAQLLRTTTSQFEAMADERQIRLMVIGPESLPAEVDGEKIQRVLLNLLSNAFKFTPDSGHITLTLDTDGQQVFLHVLDSGPGVSEALRQTIFERFRQGDGRSNRTFGGTGLGLSIVKEFVELHAGTVHVDAAPSGGADFVVQLPRYAPAGTLFQPVTALDMVLSQQLSAPAQPAPPVAVVHNHGACVLVVEDNPDMNAFLVATLSPHYQVHSARDGQEGLALAQSLQPDLILSDVMMPRMSGDDMVIALRQLPTMQDVPIVLLTAKADDELRVRMLQQGVQDYLSKPFLVEELQARVAGLLQTRSQQQSQLRRSEARFETTFERAAVGMALLSAEGKWLRVNQALCDILGYTPQDFYQYTLQDLLHPDDFLADQREKARILRGEIEHFSLEKRYRHREGHLVWTSVSIAGIREGAALQYFVSVLVDINARKQAEAEIMLLNATLERRVQARTAELTAANQELDSFSYAVSHDLRAPLRAMSGFSEALQEDYAAQLPEEAREYLQQISLASHRMSDLIDGLLVLSRCARGGIQFETVNLSQLASSILNELAQQTPQRRVDIDIAPDLMAQGDARMLQVVLRNLLDNAWKYTSHTQQAVIRFYRQDGQFRVQDNGAGFDPKHAAHLFHPFQRLHRQEEFPGIGIGLATVQRIIHRHGGTITAQSERDQGACFCFTLPNPH